jgi:DNA-binding SARP family transcriptional activator/tetratricopeptide (TPR) repeat protein
MSARLWIGALGPLSIVRDGTPLRALPAAQRAVLGLLALAGGSPVRSSTIIETLWDGTPPTSAANMVQTYMSRLRSLLDQRGDGRSVVIYDGAGYRLAVTASSFDLLGFRHLVAEAGRARSVGDPDGACTAYEGALAIWRGEPLADVDALAGHPAVIALADERAAAVRDYADLAADNGWHERALPHLRTLAGRNPLDEASQSRLMIALAGSGRQAEALDIYQELRGRLDRELGVLPGLALRDAHAKILRQEINVAGAGRGRWLPLFQLPAAPADFTGRAAESAQLADALTPRPGQSGVPLAVVSGLPGVGKTALTLHVAHTMRERFPDGQLWVHLAGMSAHPREPAEVLGEFLRALGVHGSAIPDTLLERAACYRSRLVGRRVLVVADDVATADQVRPLLPGTPGCALVATSRSHLDSLDGAYLMPLDTMPAPDAAALLTRLAGEERVRAERDAVDGLVQACGALPLALRIAGAKLAARPAWSLSLLMSRMNGTQARLRELETADLSVRASISSSYESLSERMRFAFRLLALAGEGDFAEWVIGVLLGDLDGAAGVVDELTRRSLVTPVGADATGEPRYRLHDLVRDFAASRLAAEGAAEHDQALRRLLNGWLQLAMCADAQLPPEPYFPPPDRHDPPGILPAGTVTRLTGDAMAWFSTERVNLLAVVTQACQAGRLDLAHMLASHQCAFQHLQYRRDDAERMWRILETAPQKDGGALARYAAIRIGALLSEGGHAVEAVPILDRCIDETSRHGDLAALACALEWRAGCAADLFDWDACRVNAERGVAVARGAGSRTAEQWNLYQLGVALARLGHTEQAVKVSERELRIAPELGAPTYELAALHAAAHTQSVAGRNDRAVVTCLRAIEISRGLGDILGEALAYAMLGDAYYGLGKYRDAATSLQRALPVFSSHASRRYYGICLLKLGYVYEALESPSAIGYLEESLRIFRQLGLTLIADRALQALDRLTAH